MKKICTAVSRFIKGVVALLYAPILFLKSFFKKQQKEESKLTKWLDAFVWQNSLKWSL